MLKNKVILILIIMLIELIDKYKITDFAEWYNSKEFPLDIVTFAKLNSALQGTTILQYIADKHNLYITFDRCSVVICIYNLELDVNAILKKYYETGKFDYIKQKIFDLPEVSYIDAQIRAINLLFEYIDNPF